MITTGLAEHEAPAAGGAAGAARRGLGRLWAARGWWGGLIALGLAALGQQALIANSDPDLAGRYYLAAIVLLIAVWLHPTWPGRATPPAAPSDGPAAAPDPPAVLVRAVRPGPAPPAPPRIGTESPGAGDQTAPPRPGNGRNGAAAAGPVAQVAALSAGGARVAGTAPRPVLQAWVPGAPGAKPPGARPAAAAGPAVVTRPVPAAVAIPIPRAVARPAAAASPPPAAATLRPDHAWGRWRARLGWRLTAPGLVLAAILAAAATQVLRANIANPLGGWLWAAALGTLLLTFLGVAGWPAGPGLLEGPEDDFFARGLPRVPVRLELVLAAGILLLALALRLVNLEYMPGIFGDEGERGMDARAIVQGQPTLIFGYGWWGVPNLYFYCVAWMLRIFGDTMVGDRMLSVLSGVLAVWFVYRIGRLLWGPRAGLIAGTLLAVSPLALQFSRVAGESTPTGALWAAGFFFLFRALRQRRWSDWVLAGLFCGFSLYFYAAGKLIIPLLAAAGLYCLVRWRLAFFQRYALGFVLLGLTFGLTFLPYALFSIGDNWQGFLGRAQETSIFSPQNQPQAFAKYGLPYDPGMATQPLVQNVLGHPLAWGHVLLEQLRVTAEVIYRSGDPTPFYQIRDHAGSMLPPLWAAIALLGLAYGAWKAWDGRLGLASIWFWGGMLGAALTMDTPSVQRLTGAWPVIMLFPAVILDRVWAAAWPLSRPLARVWATVPLVGLLLFFAVDGYREYFGQYAALCPYCDATTQARYAQALGQDYKGYQFGVGDYDVFFGYGSTRFAAKGVAGEDMSVPVDHFPVTDNDGKGAAFLVYSSNADYLPLLRLFYPAGVEAPIKSEDRAIRLTPFLNLFYPAGADALARTSADQVRFTSYKVSRDALAQAQTLHATYTPRSGPPVSRDEPGLGTGRAGDAPGGPWTAPPGLTFPATATWDGGLVAPGYGFYTFVFQGGADGALAVDGRPVLDTRAPAGKGLPAAQTADLVLARGLHTVRLTGTLADPQARLAVLWGPTGLGPLAVSPRYLYTGPTGGLSGEVWANTGSGALTGTDPAGGKPPTTRRSDPFLGFREARDDQESFGGGPFLARWQGTLAAPRAGSYTFEIRSNGPGLLLIDGQPVVNNPANGSLGVTAATVPLTAGPHAVELRYAWQSGRATLEWAWTPPGGTRALVPPTVLTPLARSWPRGAVPDPSQAAPAPVPAAGPPPVTVPPDTILGGDAGLKEPRGIGVGAAGDLFVGDSANHRVVHFDAAGKLLNSWGSETTDSAPGKFGLLADLATTPDGQVATLDVTTGDVQVFRADGQVTLHLPHIAPNSSGIAVGPDGRIWVAATSSSVILRFTPAGKLDATLTGGPAGAPGRFEQPIDVALAPDGTAFVVDLRDRIVQLDAAGNIAHQWPVDVGRARGGSHLTVAGGLVVMTDPDRQRLTILDPATGTVHYAGGAGSDPGQFRVPVGIATGPDGKVYVVDSENGRVQVFHDLK